jgi:F-type H+-transporting ATPase subunit delta
MKAVEEVFQDARLIINTCTQNREFVLMLRSPIIKDVKKLAIIREIFEKHLHQLTYKFLEVITRNNREGIITEIAEQIVVLYQEHKNILPIKLTTAVELDDKTKQSILDLLEKRSGSTIELSEEIDENLIGGFVLSLEDRQYDASVLRKIKNLQKEFEVNLYIKGF